MPQVLERPLDARVAPTGISMAIRTTSRRISPCTQGRPSRGDPYVHLRAINSQCHRRIVSGVTHDATSASTRRPRRSPRTARRRRSPSHSCNRRPRSCRFPVLLAQEFNHVPLLLFEPSEERRDKELQRNHGASLCQCLVDPVLRHNGQTPFFERRLQDHLLAQEPRCRCAVRLEDNAHTNRDHELEHKHVQDHVIRARFNVGTVRVLILAAVAFSFESLFSDCPNRRQGRRSAPPGTISGRAGLPDAPSSRSQPLGVIGSGRSATRSEIEAHRVLLTNSRM